MSGTWAGAFAGLGTVEGDGHLTVTFDHRRIDADRGVLFGTWRLMGPGQTIVRAGSVSGTVQGTAAQIDLSPSARRECNPPVLPFALLADGFSLAVTTAGSQIRGTVTGYGCTSAVDAAVALTR